MKYNAANTRGFVVKAKPQRKSRRCDWHCYAPVFVSALDIDDIKFFTLLRFT